MAVGGGNIFVNYGNFVSDGSASEERVAKSFDNGTSFMVDAPIGTPGRLSTKYRTAPDQFINPGTRIAMDSHGNAYANFGFATNSVSGIPFMQYRLNRSSAGGEWDYTSTNLPIGGLPIDSGTSRKGVTAIVEFVSEAQLPRRRPDLESCPYNRRSDGVCERRTSEHISEAIQYRWLDRQLWA